MDRKILVLGCSHALGSEMWLDQPAGAISDPQEDFGATNSYPMQISLRLGYLPSNHAIGGGSNDAIFRIWTQTCDQLDSKDIVIACWTGRHRSEIWHEQDQIWLQIYPDTKSYLKRVPDTVFREGRTIDQPVGNQSKFVEYTKYWHTFANDMISATNNKLKNIIALNESARAMGIRVINFDSFDPVHSAHTTQFEWPLPMSFMDFAEAHGFDHTDWGHYFLDAHSAYAEQAMEFLRA